MALRGCLAARESETESETRERTRRENGRKSEIFLQFSLRFLPARYALRDCRCEGDGRQVAAARDTRQSRWIAAGLATLCAKLLSAAAIAQTAGLASQHVGLAFCRVVPWLSELLDVFCQDRLRTAKLVSKTGSGRLACHVAAERWQTCRVGRRTMTSVRKKQRLFLSSSKVFSSCPEPVLVKRRVATLPRQAWDESKGKMFRN